MSRVVKRSLSIAGHRTSISLEEPFWQALKHIAALRGLGLAGLVQDIDKARGRSNLSSAIRVAALEHFMRRSVTAAQVSE